MPRVRPVSAAPRLPRLPGPGPPRTPGRRPCRRARARNALDGDATVADAVRRLVGLGPGLTPAGDDVVAGALVALAAGGDLERAGVVLDAVRSCRHRTTALSAALLDHAAGGRAVPQLARLPARRRGPPVPPCAGPATGGFGPRAPRSRSAPGSVGQWVVPG